MHRMMMHYIWQVMTVILWRTITHEMLFGTILHAIARLYRSSGIYMSVCAVRICPCEA